MSHTSSKIFVLGLGLLALGILSACERSQVDIEEPGKALSDSMVSPKKAKSEVQRRGLAWKKESFQRWCFAEAGGVVDLYLKAGMSPTMPYMPERALLTDHEELAQNPLVSIIAWKSTARILDIFLEAGAPADTTLNGRPLLLETTKMGGRLDRIKHLLDHGANVRNTGDLGDAIQTPLIGAAQNGDIPSIKVLIEAGARVNYRPDRDQWRDTPLTAAIFEGHSKAVGFLLSKGADPNKKRVSIWADTMTARRAPLTIAVGADKNSKPMTRMLVDAGARLSPPYGPRALELAIDNPSILKMLLQAGAPAGRPVDWSNTINQGAVEDNTPLHAASVGCYSRSASLLLQNGASVNAANSWGLYPLHEAAQSGCVSVIDTLLAHGAEVSVVDKAGRTPLHKAVTADTNASAVMNRLLNAGASPKVQGEVNGVTPLMEAVEGGTRLTVQRLLGAGAQPRRTDDKGRSAIRHAREAKRQEMVKILRNRPKLDGLSPR